MRRVAILLAAALLAAPADAQAPASRWITLGTMAGPIANRDRAQPANLLQGGGRSILVDAGDGAAEQLAKAGVALGAIDTIFISHHHFDHTGGLFALLGMRYQTRVRTPLTIYGPPGTARLVAGLVAAMVPASEVGAGVPGAPRQSPEAGITVEEIGDGARVALGPIIVTAARNSHFSYPDGSPEAARYQSLSLRFDLPDRSIVYSGDTGVSPALERLAQGADLFVSEVIDADNVVAAIPTLMPGLPPPVQALIAHHMREQHLSAEQVGTMARRAGVRRLVLTHVAVYGGDLDRMRAAAAAAYGAPVVIANDLDAY